MHSDYAMLTQHDSLATKIDNIGVTQVTLEYTCYIAYSLSTRDPIHFKQAIQYPRWAQAMYKELDSFEFNNTWIITDFPLIKRKLGLNGSLKPNIAPMAPLINTKQD